MGRTKEFYNGAYSDGLYWGREASDLVVRLGELLPLRSAVIDLGCGHGRNTIYLARRGLDVTAVDKSENAIKALRNTPDYEGLKIKTFVTDVANPALAKDVKYDGVICMYVFQDLSPNEIQKTLQFMKNRTSSRGYVAIAFSQRTERPQGTSEDVPYGDGFITKAFEGWDIPEQDTSRSFGVWGEWEEHGLPGSRYHVPRHRHFRVTLLAQKPA